MQRKIFKSLLLFLIIFSGILLFRAVFAQDFGSSEVEAGLNGALSNSDPREIAGRIINIILGVLGVIVVGLMVYAGFLWMTSNGEEDKIAQAKKILTSSVIGLAIILSSWAIAGFVLNQLSNATIGPGPITCTSGETQSCGCGGTMFCVNDSWSGCIGSDCGGGPGPIYCDIDQEEPGCQASDDICAAQDYCAADCTCQPRGNIGDSCNADQGGAVCNADDNLCAEYLSCDVDTCSCFGPPVITGISPAGGFCEEDQNKSCSTNEDCTTTCNTVTPNGAKFNLITIFGKYFGEYEEGVSKVIFLGNGNIQEGVSPANLNPVCVNFWSDDQIIISVPETAGAGPIRVIRKDSLEDDTDNDYGPQVQDFLVNDINRPGLCLITPDEGQLNTNVAYQGLNLLNGKAYFGNYQTNIQALNSSFSHASGLSGSADTPNIKAGLASTFVVSSIFGNQEKSNFLRYSKESNPDDGPYIVSFSPVTGRSGQYVTIYGDDFGGAKGSSKVYFGGVEADYNFPSICANSVWQNNQVIVKVPENIPNGDYAIKMLINDKIIDTQNLNPNFFQASDAIPLTASLCKLDPNQGAVSTEVKLYGEYFGDENSNDLVRFNIDKDVVGVVKKDLDVDSITVNVPFDEDGPAVTGPVQVIKDSRAGNSLNFTVGNCTSDDNCPGQVCCPADTYKKGRCEASLLDCLIDIPNSAFEWKFNTGFDDPGDQESCKTLASYFGECQTGNTCPNVPGVCSPYSGGLPKKVGDCDFSCESVAGCATPLGLGSACSYKSNLNKCVFNSGSCSLSETRQFNIDGQDYTFNVTCNQDDKWQLTTNASCPNGWTRGVNDICVDLESNCDSCVIGLACEQTNDGPFCTSPTLCPTGSLCVDEAGTNEDSCVKPDEASCDCCCRIENSDQDCCAPLQCAGTCGSDTTDDGVGFGMCSGCVINGVANDEACNCSGHSGQFCSVTEQFPTGVCTDCTSLDTKEECDRSSTCCFDQASSICRGGEKIPGDPNKGYCAYYDCSGDEPNTCAVDEPKTTGEYRDKTACERDCPDTNSGAGDSCIGYSTTECNFGLCTFPGMSCLIESGENASDISDCGTCCCDPSVPETCQTEEAPNLYCQANKGSCTGENRGLCCGCENDAQCGNATAIGCGVDTCCQSRPVVEDSFPESGANNICRNAVLRVSFSQMMDFTTFGGNNVLLLQEIQDDSGVCPQGTFVYDGSNNILDQNSSWLATAYKKLKFKIASILNTILGNSQVLADLPDPNKIYCSAPIDVSVDHLGDKTTLNILPRKLLAPESNYFLVVKGDEGLNSQLGVLSIYGIGLNGEGLELEGLFTEGADLLFNNVAYGNSHIINFKTLSDKVENAGVCAISNVKISPDSYLFKSTDNDLNENDADAVNATFDTVYDKDKVFAAWAYSDDGQVLKPVTGYFWEWEFDLLDEAVVEFKNVNNLSSNKKLVDAKVGVVDEDTILTATVKMDRFLGAGANSDPSCICSTEDCPENCLNAFSVGDGDSNKSNIYIFICNNPWPPVNPIGTWAPWNDNCDNALGAGCDNYDYSFYYCRDAGQAGTYDDLPAINTQAVIRGQSTTFSCSSDNSSCAVLNASCGGDNNGDGDKDGICVWSALKESYFFRSLVLPPGNIDSVIDLESGGEVSVEWTISNGQPAVSYKIYYGEMGKTLTEFVEYIPENNACPPGLDACTFRAVISNLTNSQAYVFRISAISENRAESVLSYEKIGMPTDKTPPLAITALNYELLPTQNSVRFFWDKNQQAGNDALFYRLYRGVQSGLYGESFDSGEGVNSLLLSLDELSSGNNYFVLTAIDSFNNESQKTPEIIVPKIATEESTN